MSEYMIIAFYQQILDSQRMAREWMAKHQQ